MLIYDVLDQQNSRLEMHRISNRIGLTTIQVFTTFQRQFTISTRSKMKNWQNKRLARKRMKWNRFQIRTLKTSNTIKWLRVVHWPWCLHMKWVDDLVTSTWVVDLTLQKSKVLDRIKLMGVTMDKRDVIGALPTKMQNWNLTQTVNWCWWIIICIWLERLQTSLRMLEILNLNLARTVNWCWWITICIWMEQRLEQLWTISKNLECNDYDD